MLRIFELAGPLVSQRRSSGLVPFSPPRRSRVYTSLASSPVQPLCILTSASVRSGHSERASDLPSIDALPRCPALSPPVHPLDHTKMGSRDRLREARMVSLAPSAAPPSDKAVLTSS